MAAQQNKVVAGTGRGDTTIDVQKLLDRPWYKYKHLRHLYAWLSVVLIVQATNGLDGSIILIHPGTHKSRTDKLYLRLDEIIKVLKEKGYSFERL